ncbi:MAG TPA: hypothetical protein VHH14_05725 [Solirubrobacterales bacterium]|nr:hypothetical protein [Solirubrobacterales bacterium]
MPAAPAWPESPRAPEAGTAPAAGVRSDPDPPAPPMASYDEGTRVERQPAAPPPPAAAATPPPPPPQESRGPSIDLPITTPLTLSGWLIGIGAIIAALGVIIGLFDGVLNPIELILLLGLLAIAATVFFANSLPRIPNLQLATLVVSLIGFGIALDRLGFGGAGAGELLLFLGTAAAAMGAIILELGRDQPLGPSR